MKVPRLDVLVESNGSWYVYSEDRTKRLGGPYKTRGEAVKRLQQVEYFKRQKRYDWVVTAQPTFAREVALHRQFGVKKPRRRLPRQVSPKSIAVQYAKELRMMLRLAAEAYRPLLIRLQMAKRTDAVDKPKYTAVRLVQSKPLKNLPQYTYTPVSVDRQVTPREAQRLLDEAEARLEAAVSRTQVENLASKFAARTTTYQRTQLGRQVRAALGADPYMRDPVLAGVAEDFVAQNVSLIKRIPTRMHEKIEGMVMNSVAKGQLNIDLGAEIQRQFGVAERHATLIARDQIAKYYGAVNKARQQELGVHKFIWRTVNDERVRDSHADLEDKVFSWDDLPVNEHGEEIYPGSEIQCFPGSTRASTHAAVMKLYRRWYSGECTVLTTDDGRSIQTTPNHPVLTQRGWVAAHLVDVGDHVFETSLEGIQVGVQDEQNGVPSIQEVFDALAPLGVSQKVYAPVGGFHGDVSDQQVDVVDVRRGLWREGDPEFSETFCQQLLVLADNAAAGQGNLAFCFDRFDAPTRRLVGLGCKLATCLRAGRGHALEHRLAAVAWLDTIADELIANGGAGDLKMLREALDRPPVQQMQGADFLTRVVAGIVRRALMASPGDHTPSAEVLAEIVGIDPELASSLGQGMGMQKVLRVVEKGRREYSGHVYNLETSSGWYVAEGLVVHNCRCTAEPVMDDLLDEVDQAENDLRAPSFEENDEIGDDTEQDDE